VQPDPASVVKVLKGGTGGGQGDSGKSRGGRSSTGIGEGLGEGGVAVGSRAGLAGAHKIEGLSVGLIAGEGDFGVRGDKKRAAARASVSRPSEGVRALLSPLEEKAGVAEANLLLLGASSTGDVLQPQFHTSSHWQGFRREATARKTGDKAST
jgi:hypothetical protein